MTPKQRRFAQEIVAGANPSNAYRVAYESSGMTAKSVSSEASKLLQHPEIARTIREGEQAALNESVWNRQEAISRLQSINLRCFQAVLSADGVPEKSALTGFFESLDRLNSLCCVSDEVADASFEAFCSRL